MNTIVTVTMSTLIVTTIAIIIRRFINKKSREDAKKTEDLIYAIIPIVTEEIISNIAFKTLIIERDIYVSAITYAIMNRIPSDEYSNIVRHGFKMVELRMEVSIYIAKIINKNSMNTIWSK